MRRLNRRGISPVIATIIIVAVAIAIAIAVAFWVVGIAGLFTRYEKLEISYIYCSGKDTSGRPIIVLQVKNTGSATATIDEVFINGVPDANAKVALTTSLSPGGSIVKTFTCASSHASGATLEVKIHTASGQEYYKAVVVP
ncbi:MAG: archaellin/type IV pilin N-terminal domain-containing protein [Candidatus Methanomethylicia archaeon]